MLPVGIKDPKFGKWSQNWDGPFVVHKVLGKRAYHLKDRTGLVHTLPINAKFLKKYYLITWESKGVQAKLQRVNQPTTKDKVLKGQRKKSFKSGFQF